MCHVDDHTDPDKAQFDMIIGADVMHKLGVDVSFSKHHISWDDTIVCMKERGAVSNGATTEDLCHIAVEPTVLKLSEQRHHEITKLMHQDANVPECAQNITELSEEQKKQLGQVLKSIPELHKQG